VKVFRLIQIRLSLLRRLNYLGQGESFSRDSRLRCGRQRDRGAQSTRAISSKS